MCDSKKNISSTTVRNKLVRADQLKTQAHQTSQMNQMASLMSLFLCS
jgi:hypothetical protein